MVNHMGLSNDAAMMDDHVTDSEETRLRYRAPALEKGLDILELLAREGQPLTPSIMAARLDRSVSELFRMILVLEHRGYIAQSADQQGFELTNKLFTLGMAKSQVKSLLEVATPLMRDLSEKSDQSCHLAIASGDQMVVVARIENSGLLGGARRQERSVAGLAAGATDLDRPAPDQCAGRYHQLHDLRPRAAAACVRRQKGHGQSTVRRARDGETLLALDGRTYTLDNSVCVIADDHGVIRSPASWAARPRVATRTPPTC